MHTTYSWTDIVCCARAEPQKQAKQNSSYRANDGDDVSAAKLVEWLCLNSNVVLPVVYATLVDVWFRTVNCSRVVGNHKSGLPPTPMGVPKWASPPIYNRLIGTIATAS